MTQTTPAPGPGPGPLPVNVPTGVPRELLDRIRAAARTAEADHVLPFDAVRALVDAGFTRLRVPVEHGGAGLDFTAFVEELLELARADSNLPQLLRGHVGFVELVLAAPDGPWRRRWLDDLGRGVLVGNAQSERGSTPVSSPQTRLQRNGSVWIVTGTKFYSTGTLFADWTYLSAVAENDGVDVHATAVVTTDHPGVVRHDDWDGFGQRLTGSGTTQFCEVPVRADDVTLHTDGHPVNSQQAVFQTVHLATLAGIAQAARDDVVEFVRARTRNGYTAAVELPRHDPQVQQVVGEVQALVVAATATTREAARAVARLQEAERAGTVTERDHAAADAVVFAAQGAVIDLVLRATAELFRVGGSSATSTSLGLDRHWRNARTVSSHNPEVFRARALGDHLLNGTPPARRPGRRDDRTASVSAPVRTPSTGPTP